MKAYIMKGLYAAIVMAASPVWGDCNNALPKLTPDSQFILKAPTATTAVVRDNKTGLIWLRCSLGQAWDAANRQCMSDNSPALFTWNEALAAAKASRYGNFDDWRLPNKKELASLAELACTSPAINSNVFPNTNPGRYWSATPTTYSTQFSAWYIDFNNGSYGNNLGADAMLSVRLVRDED